MEDLIIEYLIQGKNQREISELLKENSIEPNSLSFIEKCLKKLRVKYKATSMFHLGYILAKQRKR